MATQQKLNPNFIMYMHRTISDTYQKHEDIIHGPFIGKSDKLKQQETQYHITSISTLFRKWIARISQAYMDGRLLSTNRGNAQMEFFDGLVLQQLLQSLPCTT